MEFEGALLSTLSEASCPADWEDSLSVKIGKVAGDDYTMVMAAFGFGDFQKLKKYFDRRYVLLRKKYLDIIDTLSPNDAEGRRRLWKDYRADYCRNMNRITEG